MTFEQIGLNAAYVLLPFLFAALTALGAMLAKKINTEEGKIKNDQVRVAVQSATSALEGIAYNVVNKLEQTTVATMRSASTDGKLTTDNVKQLQAEALDTVKQIAGNGLLNLVKSNFGNVETFIMALVESHVLNLKMQTQLQNVTVQGK